MRDLCGRRVPEEVPEKRAGTIACDGWVEHGAYHARRCWARMLREMRDMCAKNPDNWNAAHIARMFERIFRDAAAASGVREAAGARKAARRRLICRARHIARRYMGDPAVGKTMGRMDRAAYDLLGPWQTIPVPPPAEQHRRARAARDRRAQEDARGHQGGRDHGGGGCRSTCVMTWKPQGRGCRAELVKRA